MTTEKTKPGRKPKTLENTPTPDLVARRDAAAEEVRTINNELERRLNEAQAALGRERPQESPPLD